MIAKRYIWKVFDPNLFVYLPCTFGELKSTQERRKIHRRDQELLANNLNNKKTGQLPSYYIFSEDSFQFNPRVLIQCEQ